MQMCTQHSTDEMQIETDAAGRRWFVVHGLMRTNREEHALDMLAMSGDEFMRLVRSVSVQRIAS